ncbi:penicillin-binding protein [Blastococcus sp. CT_GayMR20]|uniref:transglycosylase domain-containing protein n=1 Tax=Blastococcus sp. CT_GayMR20 TaxID=2559609 RepID=UPI0010737089|nr:transglycosylase domain-containing protein [Blastococcus sp. CT_GayMR20]TFV85785.1 penicillin-binding protein [Blastococcus sp. CT_GayMR20]
MPSHDETSPVAPRAGSVRRPAPARTRSTGGGGAAGRGRPPAGGRARTTASRTGAGAPPRTGGPGRPPAGRGPAKGSAKPKGKGPRSKKQRRKRRLKIAAGVIGGLFVLLGVFVGVVYASTEVPSPDSISTAQTTVIYYSDGQSEMARLGDENRTNVQLEEVSEPARNAVLAAENRSFFSDPGISFTGIIRATWNNLTGGSTQGGSTITQQYVKNAILQNSEQTFSRKFQELFLAIKLDNNYSKDQILENYLNTIYYGRGAYGIESAANTYFGVPAAQLTAEQGAVLAVLIRSPSANDPEVDPEGAQRRWGLVLDAMVEEEWMSADARAAAVYPPVLPKAGSSLGIPSGPEGLIVQQVKRELMERYQYSEQQVDAGGLRITTTVNAGHQDIAEATVAGVMDGEPENLREALVAVDPRTGGVTAYYGGAVGTDNDYARAQRQPGSSMKPYALAAALDQGIGVEARRDGSSPQKFEDRELEVVNSGGASCASCTLREAITRSLNTTFYGLAYEVGPDKVREVALAATGMPESWQIGGQEKPTLANADGLTGSAIGIGEYEMRPINQAVGFATFASGGIYRTPHFIQSVADSEGAVLLKNEGEAGEQVIRPDVANDVTYALLDVADSSDRGLDGGREVASKTGTQGLNRTDNSDAWMVGYTPSISTAVWIGSDVREPIKDYRERIIYGSGLPGQIWQEFMDAVLAGTPEEDMADEPMIEGDTGEGVEAPAPEPTETSAPPPPPAPEQPVDDGTTEEDPADPVEPPVEEPVDPADPETPTDPQGGTPALPANPGNPQNPPGGGNPNG